MITAIESGDADRIKSLFAKDLQKSSDDLDVGIQGILSLYQAGGEKDKIGFRHVAMCYQANFWDEDVVIAYPQCEGVYAYCSDEAKKRINRKLEEAGYDDRDR